MLVKLLNDGGYDNMENVKFPIVVNGKKWPGKGFDVSVSEVNKHGATFTGDGFLYFSLLSGECEVVNEE